MAKTSKMQSICNEIRKWSYTSGLGVCVLISQVMADKNMGQRNLITYKMHKENLLETENSIKEAKSGIERHVYNETFDPKIADPVKVAKSYLQYKRKDFGITDTSEIKIKRIMKTPGGTHVYVEQVVDGIPVYSSSGTIAINNDGTVKSSINNYRNTFAGKKALKKQISSTEAIRIAQKHINLQKRVPKVKEECNMMWFESEDVGAELAYKVNISAEEPAGDWQIFINAENGRIIQVTDELMKAQVFKPDPLTTANQAYGGTMVDNNDNDNTEINNQRQSVTLQELKVINGLKYLQGPNCVITDIEPPNYTYPGEVLGLFDFTRSEQGFEAANAYYHIDKSARWLAHLGYWVGTGLCDTIRLGKLRVDPHGLRGKDDSHFSIVGNHIAFGEGGVDDAEDADVILHEYEHAIQHHLTGGMIYQGETMYVQEGSCDYWAASYSRAVNTYYWKHLFNWDGHNEYWSGRVCDVDWVYGVTTLPDGAKGGQIWSSALMEIWGDLGKEITDKIFLEAHLRWGQAPSLRSAARAFVEAEYALYNGKYSAPIIKRFSNHGLYSNNYISQIPFTINSSNVGCTNEWDVQGTDGADVAFFIQLNEATRVDISLALGNTNYDTKLEIFRANRTSTGFYSDDCSINNYSFASVLSNLDLLSGGYYIVVDGYNGAQGNFTLQVTYTPNSSPNISSLPFKIPGSTIGRPNSWDVGGSDGSDMAYNLFLPYPASVDISTESVITNFDSKLEIFNIDGSSTGYYNDDYVSIQACIKDAKLAAGNYIIVVDGYSGQTGNFELNVSYGADYTFTAVPFSHSGSTVNQGDQWYLSGSCANDVTYKLILFTGTKLQVSLCSPNTNYNSRLMIFNPNGTPTGYQNDDYCGIASCIENAFLPAGTYYLVVDGLGASAGNYTLNVTPDNSFWQMDAGLSIGNTNINSYIDKAELFNAYKYGASNSVNYVNLSDIDSLSNVKDAKYNANYIYEINKQLNGNKPLVTQFNGTHIQTAVTVDDALDKK